MIRDNNTDKLINIDNTKRLSDTFSNIYSLSLFASIFAFTTPEVDIINIIRILSDVDYISYIYILDSRRYYLYIFTILDFLSNFAVRIKLIKD